MEEAKSKRDNTMDKLEFLLGTWNLRYNVPKSTFHQADTGSGTGTFKRALDNKYVYFDYSMSLDSEPNEEGKAHAIFAWDQNIKAYRFWWFENSGAFTQATCNFINDKILFMNWHNSLLIQTFTQIDENKVILKMQQPIAEDKFELVLEVILTRK